MLARAIAPTSDDVTLFGGPQLTVLTDRGLIEREREQSPLSIEWINGVASSQHAAVVASINHMARKRSSARAAARAAALPGSVDGLDPP